MWFHRHHHRWGHDRRRGRGKISLADVPPGSEVTLLSYEDVDLATAGSLRAYGLLPGRRVRVLAQEPVTIVQVEQTEMALEHLLARAICVRLCPFAAGMDSGEEDQTEDCTSHLRSSRSAGRHRP